MRLYALKYSAILSCIIALAPQAKSQTYTESMVYEPAAESDGINIASRLIQANDGKFYGVASATGNGSAVFSLSSTGNGAVFFRFPASYGNAAITGLTQGSDGNLYGPLTLGGPNNGGAIYKITPEGVFSILHSFCSDQQPSGDCPNGENPYGTLIQGTDGSFYGTTLQGGANSYGEIFKVSLSGAITVLYSFCTTGGNSCTDGRGPENGLVQGTDGNFYGTTEVGGAPCSLYSDGCGIFFRITPAGNYTVLHNFTGGSDGAFPNSTLIQAPDGNFYGRTTYGGANYSAHVFRITPTGDAKTLYRLSAYDGPNGDLYLGSDGNLYGTDNAGGSAGNGSVYKIEPNGNASVIYSFDAVYPYADGTYPDAPPVQGNNGSLYGTTFDGGNELDGDMYQSGGVYEIVQSPVLSPPVGFTLSKSSITLGESVAIDWNVTNAYSDTLQQCYAFAGGGAGNWTGQQIGSFNSEKSPPYSGSATVTPTAVGTYNYALTCGGTETGIATLSVLSSGGKSSTTTALTSSANPVSISQNVTFTAKS